MPHNKPVLVTAARLRIGMTLKSLVSGGGPRRVALGSSYYKPKEWREDKEVMSFEGKGIISP